MVVVTFLGGLLGSVLLLRTPLDGFSSIVPWLLLLGSTAFAFGKSLGDFLRKHIQIHALVLLVSQFLLGIYGGYFWGGVGIMMMAVWSMLLATVIGGMLGARYSKKVDPVKFRKGIVVLTF